MNFESRSFDEVLLYLSLIFFLFFIPLSIAVSESFLFLSFVVWVFLLIRKKRSITFPSFFIPLIFYSFFTVLSTLFSIDLITSLKDIKEILLFLIVPVLFNSFNEEKIFLSFNYAISFSIFLSFLASLAEYSGIFLPQERVSGFLGHYMTQSGVLLLTISFSFANILGEGKFSKLFWTFIFIISWVSLLLTFARSAWIGAFFAISLILILFRPKFLILLIPLLVLILLFSPINVKKRFLSIFDPKDDTNRDRIHMGIAGIKIISKYPLFGSGPDTVRLIYGKFKPREAMRDNPHLHNNILQIFAERGVLALLSWLWFIYLAAKKNLEVFRESGNRFFKISALGAVGAIAGLFFAGLFEYNFGDSEVKMLFLYIITYPLLILKEQNTVMNKISLKGVLR